MSLEISLETEARIAGEARKHGLSVDALLDRLMNEHAGTTPASGSALQPGCPFFIWGQWVLYIGATSTTMSVEPGILDANILAYAFNAPQHKASRALLESVRDPLSTLYLTSQILCEFYSVITNPRRVVVPSSSAEALSIIAALMALPGLRVLPIPANAVEGWVALLKHRPVTGSSVFDRQRSSRRCCERRQENLHMQ